MRRAAIGLVLLLALPVAAVAAGELALVLGARIGDVSFPVEADATGIACLIPPCVVAEASTPESEVLGLVVDLPIARGWMLSSICPGRTRRRHPRQTENRSRWAE